MHLQTKDPVTGSQSSRDNVFAAPVRAVQLFVKAEYPARTPTSSIHPLDDTIFEAMEGADERAARTDQPCTFLCVAFSISFEGSPSSDDSGLSRTDRRRHSAPSFATEFPNDCMGPTMLRISQPTSNAFGRVLMCQTRRREVQ
jgi:hypothetical protein